jgi:hypothetical protein
MKYRLFALVFGDEVYVGCGNNLDKLRTLAYQQSYILKYETGLAYIQFYIQDSYKIVDEFVY